MSEENDKQTSTANYLLRFIILRPLIIGVAVVMVLIAVVISLFLYDVIIVGPRDNRAQAATREYALSQAKQVDGFVTEQQSRLATLVEKIADQPLLASGEQEDLRKLESLIQTTFPSADHLYLLDADDPRLEDEKNFAAYDLVLRTRKGEKTTVEAALVEGRWLLQWAAAVPQGKNDDAARKGVTLVVNLAMPVKLLTAQLGRLDDGVGQTRLAQSSESYPAMVFATAGQAGDLEESFIGEAPTGIPHWQVRFVASHRLLEANTSYQGSFLILFATMILELSLLMFYRGIRQFRADLLSGALEPKRPSNREMSDEDRAMSEQAARQFLDSIPLKQIGDDSEKPADGAAEGSTQETETVAEKEDKDASLEMDIASEKPLLQTEPLLVSEIPREIFREYDIRGIVDQQLDVDLARKIGTAIGSEALQQGQTTIVVGHDGRLSSPKLYEAVTTGILASGCDVIMQGQIPTPMLYFATEELEQTNSGVMVTGSHNPPEYNGFKIVIDGEVLSGDKITDLYRRIEEDDIRFGEGERATCDLTEEYISRILGDIVPASRLTVVVDAGNGVAGPLGADALSAVGCEVVELNCEIDGNFPRHHPDPTVPENLRELAAVVRRETADLGIAFDGDGDRLVAITRSGRIVWPDELLMIFARDVLTRCPGTDIVYDVKSTRRLKEWISNHGGRPVMGKTGHAHMRHLVRESEASLGGEFSGHLFFPDRWYNHDDGIYAAARLVEILTMREQNLDEVVATLPVSFSTPEIIRPVGESRKFEIIEKLIADNNFKDAKLNTLDGLLVEYPKARGLVRASQTTPCLSLRFEADDEESLTQIKQLFKREVQRYAPDIDF